MHLIMLKIWHSPHRNGNTIIKYRSYCGAFYSNFSVWTLKFPDVHWILIISNILRLTSNKLLFSPLWQRHWIRFRASNNNNNSEKKKNKKLRLKIAFQKVLLVVAANSLFDKNWCQVFDTHIASIFSSTSTKK